MFKKLVRTVLQNALVIVVFVVLFALFAVGFLSSAQKVAQREELRGSLVASEWWPGCTGEVTRIEIPVSPSEFSRSDDRTQGGVFVSASIYIPPDGCELPTYYCVEARGSDYRSGTGISCSEIE